MKKIIISDLDIVYGNGFRAIKGLDLSIEPNEFICILGPSGCGKTTILNTIAGFLKPLKGEIAVNFEKCRQKGGTGIIFQDSMLFPWKTVEENIAFSLETEDNDRETMKKTVDGLLEKINLKSFGKSYPYELSGGMNQRVGIARALANNPEILLMDEPFGSLDVQTRMQMQKFILSLFERDKKTVVFVTHDIDEAILLADRIIILTKAPGKVKKEIRVGIKRPRNHKTTLTKEFIRIKKQILETLEEEFS